MNYVIGATLRRLREGKHLTQKALADQLMVSEKTISKWDTDRGLPDISILGELAAALDVSVAELLTGDIAENRNRSSNMKRSLFYVCPVCGNIIHSMGAGAFSCCGIRLPPLEAEPTEETHEIQVEDVDGEWYVHMDHPMERRHYITMIAFVTDCQIQMEKLYPEQNAELRFRKAGHGILYALCNRDGLFMKKL